MRRLLAVLLVLSAAACGGGAVSVDAQIAACEREPDFATRVAVCTAVVRAEAASASQRALAYANRGEARFNLGEQARAIADFGRALRLDPNLASAYFDRGLVHHSRGAFESALADYDRALALDPALSEAAQRRGLALTQRIDDFATLLIRADSLIEADPANAANWNNRCWIRAVEGVDLGAALSDCNRALQMQPAEAQTLDSRGLVYLKLGEPGAALSDYEAAVRLNAQEAHFLYGRGIARLRLGRVGEGQADLDAALTLDPAIADTYAAYGVSPTTPAAEAELDVVKK
ncbi:hypothetical protein U91I_03161 [alpha proteobacterium U9-1i]|nr:hypothetical protein U91I_03161 [alpha proteobacterium U9-1i]